MNSFIVAILTFAFVNNMWNLIQVVFFNITEVQKKGEWEGARVGGGGRGGASLTVY